MGKGREHSSFANGSCVTIAIEPESGTELPRYRFTVYVLRLLDCD